MTDAQEKALRRMAQSPYVAPSDIGYAMTPDREVPLRSQGAGRIGGAMAKRLIALGLAQDCSHLRWGFPAYRITRAGRVAIGECR